MRLGAHESTAGGVHLAFGRGEADGCEALQIFVGHNTRWARRPIDAVSASCFRSERARLGWPVLAHAKYLVNLASPRASLRRRSIEALLEEMVDAETLGLDGLVLHPGSHMGAGVAAGVGRVCESLGELHRRTRGFALRLLLENTAGAGHGLGASFDELGRILAGTFEGDRLGICLDTCHAWAAGYDLASAAGTGRLLAELEGEVGLERVLAFHLNDCRRGRGERVDRHAHIGEGTMGLPAFARLVNEPRFAGRPALVETPPEADGTLAFARNLRTLKALRRAAEPGAEVARG